jgi:hypothetical protein
LSTSQRADQEHHAPTRILPEQREAQKGRRRGQHRAPLEHHLIRHRHAAPVGGAQQFVEEGRRNRDFATEPKTLDGAQNGEAAKIPGEGGRDTE